MQDYWSNGHRFRSNYSHYIFFIGNLSNSTSVQFKKNAFGSLLYSWAEMHSADQIMKKADGCVNKVPDKQQNNEDAKLLTNWKGEIRW